MSVYFDHNATTPLDAEVLAFMMPYLKSHYANPSSLHQAGRIAKSAIDTARHEIAKAINCEPQQVFFTSGGTESNNWVFQAHQGWGFWVGSVEHASVLSTAKLYALQTPKTVAVDELGRYQFDDLDLGNEQSLISVQLVNNETGVIHAIEQLQGMLGATKLHCDASQAIGKVAVDFAAMGVDFLTLSAHKFNGPKGCGALIAKDPEDLQARAVGGFQEAAKRAGTENVAAIVGMGKAITLAVANQQLRNATTTQLRDYFEQGLLNLGATIFAQQANRVGNTSFFALPYFHGETLLMECDKAGYALASGSACHSQVTAPSHVLSAMGVSEEIAINAIRASFAASNTQAEVDGLLRFFKQQLENLPSIIKSVVNS